ncbi:MAG: hypothetical protein WC607_00025 [Candidatus Micrarchaeia archaeon]
MKKLLWILLLLPLASAECVQMLGQTVCPFNAGEFNSLTEPAAIRLESIAQRTLAENGFLYNTVGVDDECFETSLAGGILTIEYKASCQACHSRQEIQASHPSLPGYQILVQFSIDCSDIDTLFLGNYWYGLDLEVKEAIEDYAVDARERNEKVKYIDYASGEALVDSAYSGEITDPVCFFPRGEGLRLITSDLIRTNCVDYLKEHVISDDGALVLLGDNRNDGVLLYGAGDLEYTPKSYEGEVMPERFLSDNFYDSYFRAHYDKSDYDPEEALIISRLPGDRDLIVELIERGPANIVNAKPVIYADFPNNEDQTGMCAENNYQWLLRHRHDASLKRPPICQSATESSEVFCDLNLLTGSLRESEVVMYDMHGSGIKFQSYNAYFLTRAAIEQDAIQQYDNPKIILAYACYGASLFENQQNEQSDYLLAHAALDRGAFNLLGLNAIGFGGLDDFWYGVAGTYAIYDDVIKKGYSLGKAVTYLPRNSNFDYFNARVAMGDIWRYMLRHITLLGLPNSRITANLIPEEPHGEIPNPEYFPQ